MRAALLAVPLICAAAFAFAAPALPPRVEWQQGIAEQNKDYAAIPHAMLKIQDAAYIGEGQTAALIGEKGKPASWRWSRDGKARNPRLAVAVKGGKLLVLKDGVVIDPALMTKNIPIDADVDIAGQPTQVGAGVNGWRIFVYNQKNAAARDFQGVSYYPYDPAFRVTARFVADRQLPPRVFRTSRGTDKQFFHAGDAHLKLGGREMTLPFYSDSRDPAKVTDISAFYTDELSGEGAYPTGRYVDAAGFGKFPPATITIDFNFAYNPNCARSAFFTCPLATDHIALAMKAGEQDPHKH